jgi:hypothetical protein
LTGWHTAHPGTVVTVGNDPAPPAVPEPPGELAHALLKPLPGHTDQDVVASLHAAGAVNVSRLAAGFISARASHAAFDSLRQIASVQIKPRQHLRAA